MRDREQAPDQRVRVKQPERSDTNGPCADCPKAPPLVSSLGNAAVQRLLRSTKVEDEQASADDAIAGAIEAERGGGSALDADAAERFGGALGTDLSGVRVHTDGAADSLNESVRAEAFTTGSDIFFRQGNYQPGTSAGDELLAHELTHVVQQGGSPDSSSSSGLDVSDPQDASEREADSVAQQLTSPGGGIDRQEVEEDELMMSPAIDRQEEEEEEMLQYSLQRQEEEEDLMMSPALDRQEEEEEMLLE